MSDNNEQVWINGRPSEKTPFISEIHAVIRDSDAFPGEGEYRVTEIHPDGRQIVTLSRSLKGMRA